MCNSKNTKRLRSSRYIRDFLTLLITQLSRSVVMSSVEKTKYGTLTSTPYPKDRIHQVQGQVEELKEVMIENINKTIQRGEDLERLDERASELENDARTFEKRATSLKWSQRCAFYKWRVLVFLIVMIVIVLILWASGLFSN